LAARRNAARVCIVDEARRSACDAGEVAAEEADDRARAAGGVRLAPLERREERVARVLLGPRDGEPAGVVAHVRADLERGRRVVVPLRTGPALLRDAAGGAVVVVGRADEPEAERIRAELILEREAILQRVPDHVPRRVLIDRDRIAGRTLLRLVQLLEAAELVRRAGAGAGQAVEAALGVTLDLVDLPQALEGLAPASLD